MIVVIKVRRVTFSKQNIVDQSITILTVKNSRAFDYKLFVFRKKWVGFCFVDMPTTLSICKQALCPVAKNKRLTNLYNKLVLVDDLIIRIDNL